MHWPCFVGSLGNSRHFFDFEYSLEYQEGNSVSSIMAVQAGPPARRAGRSLKPQAIIDILAYTQEDKLSIRTGGPILLAIRGFESSPGLISVLWWAGNQKPEANQKLLFKTNTGFLGA
jgi:hypothetical protein